MKISQLGENALLAHEIGHILGNTHWGQQPSPTWSGQGYGVDWRVNRISDIMAFDGSARNLIFSSPTLLTPGLVYALEIAEQPNCQRCSRYHQNTGLSNQYNNDKSTNDPIFIKRLATNNPPVPDVTIDPRNIQAPALPLIPFGTQNHDATQTIHNNAPSVANYRASHLKIQFLDPIPERLGKGKSVTVQIKVSGCSQNSHRVLMYANTPGGQLFWTDVTFGSEIILTPTLTMPSTLKGSSSIITFVVFLETVSGNPSYWNEPGYETAGEWKTIFCGDCSSLRIADLKGNDLSQATNPSYNNIPKQRNNKERDIITKLNLEQNAPNPFSNQTTIRFSLPKASQTTLKIYNAFGIEVATLINSALNAGEHSIDFSAAQFSSGFYLYRLQTEYGVLSRKMIIIK